MTASLRGVATRRRILECAVARFADQGFRLTSVAQVARDARLTPPAVHAHFGSKEALFQAAFEQDVASFLDVLQARTTGGTLTGAAPLSGLGLLPELVAATEDHPLVRRIFRGLEPDRTAELFRSPAVMAVREQLVSVVRAGQQRAVLRSDLDPAALAGALETMVLALVLGAVQVGLTNDAARAAVMEIIRQGVRALP